MFADVPRDSCAHLARPVSTPCAYLKEPPAELEATVAVGRRVYLITLFHDGPDRGAVFDALAATIDLRPEDVPTPSGTPS